MYTVSKGPSKIVAKTRRGISQNLERLETLRDLTRKADPDDDHEITRHVPKPVFHMNGKSKFSSQRHQMQEVITPQHEELIKFVYESWNQVNTRQRSESSDGSDCSEPSSPNTIVYYNDGEPNDTLQDFKPFDLESWWGKRLFNNITKSL
ncbi:MAPK regulated corepressor interacting protein 2 isoform X2 [Apis laboriosa]|uniref:MAPK regulated corepressor interacting protein 2 n=1 Tax=Apis mellifera TaxID=7460 RepID=A0A7M7TF19_APIME|nr:MAPK regulated corepressor interacting protein 2 [Apis dorsata]XP_043795854.1 MAPK regulated corepressor interacting protein 2 isoform X2 [Apis laboriosa]XP_393143.2 MAPK regulated corepressor interacting protein 2 [Apis mellifera]KAG6800541.1 MAPK regulated corepressor interacting protein 2 [Apis mellifera caucasica]KAG9434472.1 MAPK regulated corepressor interacting protein 2 [Apis mellifera carnica]|eukprot:XP_393143.2 MAPK regulated corepressor interacting protein 2 [Apis mellifera]